MKTRNQTIIALSACVYMVLSVILQPTPATAETKVIIVEMTRVIENSLAGKSLIEESKDLIEEHEKKIQIARSDLEGKARALESQRNLMTEEAWNKKFTRLQEEEKEANEEIVLRARSIQAGNQKTRNELLDIIRPIIKDLKEEYDANIVLERATTLSIDEEIDVSDEVIKRLDKEIKKVEVVPIEPEEEDE